MSCRQSLRVPPLDRSTASVNLPSTNTILSAAQNDHILDDHTGSPGVWSLKSAKCHPRLPRTTTHRAEERLPVLNPSFRSRSYNRRHPGNRSSACLGPAYLSPRLKPHGQERWPRIKTKQSSDL